MLLGWNILVTFKISAVFHIFLLLNRLTDILVIYIGIVVVSLSSEKMMQSMVTVRFAYSSIGLKYLCQGISGITSCLTSEMKRRVKYEFVPFLISTVSITSNDLLEASEFECLTETFYSIPILLNAHLIRFQYCLEIMFLEEPSSFSISTGLPTNVPKRSTMVVWVAIDYFNTVPLLAPFFWLHLSDSEIFTALLKGSFYFDLPVVSSKYLFESILWPFLEVERIITPKRRRISPDYTCLWVFSRDVTLVRDMIRVFNIPHGSRNKRCSSRHSASDLIAYPYWKLPSELDLLQSWSDLYTTMFQNESFWNIVVYISDGSLLLLVPIINFSI